METDSIFIRGLALFKTRTAYANIINDKSVPYHTAAISEYDPYLNITRINLSYLPSYSSVILHPTRPIIPLNKPKDLPQPSNMRRFLFLIGLALLLPLWLIFFVLASLYQSFFSARRIRQHLQLRDRDTLRETSLSSAVQEVFEDVVDNTNFFSPTEDRDDEYFHYHDSGETTLLDPESGNKPVSSKREEYRLALTEDQLNMMNGLRSLPWQTFGVHIQKSTHSHAAIIRRTKWRKELSEGEMVIQHWLDGQFEA